MRYTIAPRSLKLVTKMGFVEEARVKDAVPDGDIIFLSIQLKATKVTASLMYYLLTIVLLQAKDKNLLQLRN